MGTLLIEITTLFFMLCSRLKIKINFGFTVNSTNSFEQNISSEHIYCITYQKPY